jgi:PAS domain-containing protein
MNEPLERLRELTEQLNKRDNPGEYLSSKFAAFMDSAPYIIFIKDEQGVFVYVNAMFLSAFKMQHVDIIGKLDTDMPWHEKADYFRANDKAAMYGGKAKLAAENVAGINWLIYKFGFQNNGQGLCVGGIGFPIDLFNELYERAPSIVA